MVGDDERSLYEKVAFLPAAGAAGALGGTALRWAATTALPAAGRFLWHGARAAMGAPATKTLAGAANTGRKAGTLVAGANAVGGAAALAGMASDLVKSPSPPAPNSANVQATAGGRYGYASLQERAEKLAFGPSNAVNIASYAAMIGANLVPHDHPWHARLEALGLAGLAGTTLHDVVKGEDAWKPGLKDLVGLGLFASALNDRTKHASVASDAVTEGNPLYLDIIGRADAPTEHRMGFASVDVSRRAAELAKEAYAVPVAGAVLGGLAGAATARGDDGRGPTLGQRLAGGLWGATVGGALGHAGQSVYHGVQGGHAPQAAPHAAQAAPQGQQQPQQQAAPEPAKPKGKAAPSRAPIEAQAPQAQAPQAQAPQAQAPQAQAQVPQAQVPAPQAPAPVATPVSSGPTQYTSVEHMLEERGLAGMGGPLGELQRARATQMWNHGHVPRNSADFNHALSIGVRPEDLRAALQEGGMPAWFAPHAEQFLAAAPTPTAQIPMPARSVQPAGPVRTAPTTAINAVNVPAPILPAGAGRQPPNNLPRRTRDKQAGFDDGLDLYRALAESAHTKEAFLGPGGDVMMLGLPSAVGYVAGRREPMTLDEARHEAHAKMNPAAFAFVPGYTGYYHGVRSKAERMLAGEEAPDDTMARAEAARQAALTPEARRAAFIAGLGGGAGAALGGAVGQRVGGTAGGVAGVVGGAGLGAWLGSRAAE